MDSLMMRAAVTVILIGTIVPLMQGNFQGALAGGLLLGMVGMCHQIGKRGWFQT